jgi:phosphate transport system permease protein
MAAPPIAAGERPPPARTRGARREPGLRFALDRLATRVVVAGGVLVIASILAIFFVIAGEVYPLFQAPEIALQARVPAPAVAGVEAALGAPGVDEYREIAFQILPAGTVAFSRLAPGPSLSPLDLPGVAPATVVAIDSRADGRTALGTSDGRVALLELRFDVAFAEGARSSAPRAVSSEPLAFDPEGARAVRRIAFAAPAAGPLFAGELDSGEVALLRVRERRALVGAVTREVARLPVALPRDARVSALAIDERGDDLFVGTAGGRLLRYDLRDPALARLAEEVAAAPAATAISALGFAIGDRTLVVGDGAGRVSSWQVVGLPGEGERRTTRIHEFEPHPGAVISIAPSPRSKAFATADASGIVRLHHATSARTLLSVEAGPGPLRAVAIAPKGDGVVAATGGGALAHFALDAPHPEITLRTLFGPTWYEGYAEPGYVWQSHGGTDDFEPKFSLTPLLFGTLKGTVYALLFAVPIALLAALYASEFMHPDLKAWVKPGVEVMAGLPSVVLGFVAGLWLAPSLERVMPGVFLVPPVLAGSIVLALLGWRALPVAVRRRVRPGAEIFVLLPVVAVSIALALRIGGLLESALLGDDYRAWLGRALGITFDQRNSVVVGIAMGFAVVPVIFTIAEDSLANVGRQLRAGSLALGATPWQTALRVVVPSASPGIFSAVMIGFGRAVGETMIVLMATGNTPVLDWSIFNGFRALSANVAVELPEAPDGSTHFRVLFLAALLLFGMTFVLNTLAEAVRLRLRARFREL